MRLFDQFKNGTRYSIQGLEACFNSEFAFRIECYLSIVIIPLIWGIAHDFASKGVLLISWLLVLAFELINSAVEKTLDRVSTEYDERIKAAKDMASAAVFLTNMLFGVLFLLCLATRLL